MSKGLNVFFVVLRAKEDYLTSWVFKRHHKMAIDIFSAVYDQISEICPLPSECTTSGDTRNHITYHGEGTASD